MMKGSASGGRAPGAKPVEHGSVSREVTLAQRFYVIGQKVMALAAVVFGAATVVAGARVLTGSDPGYVVYLPLLIYNSVMGVVYIGVGASAWQRIDYGRNGAAAVFLLNLLVLVAIWILYTSGGAVAVDSLRAMMLRTAVWGALFVGFWWLNRRSPDTPAQGE